VWDTNTKLTSAPRSSVLSVENLNIMITSAPRKVNITNNVQIENIDNSKIIEDAHIHHEVTNNIVDNLVKSSIVTFDETHVHEENIHDDQDALVESSTLILDDIDVTDDDSSDSGYVIVEFNISVQIAGYSVVILMIDD